MLYFINKLKVTLRVCTIWCNFKDTAEKLKQITRIQTVINFKHTKIINQSNLTKLN